MIRPLVVVVAPLMLKPEFCEILSDGECTSWASFEELMVDY
jgi:hypothetical protein